MHSNSNTVAVQIKSMHKLTNTAEKRADWMHLLESIVSFIPFFVFGFWSLLAMKLQKYENIT